MKYRPEIDGLRAIAVTAVVLFHADIPGVPGGFIGVDVFFVISGFLITQIIADELDDGRFSLARFYERRARRILPALYVVVAASFAAALYYLLPAALTEFSRSASAALLFLSNAWFYHTTSYFATEAAREPLLHTWSLGVEEQYYLLFPLLMLLIWRFRRSRVGVVLGLITVASLVLSEVAWRVAPAANFYLLPTRAWQLGLGSLGALLWRRTDGRIVRGRFVGEALAAAGLGLVAGSVVLMDASVPFPSVWAVLPTGGALMILLFARGDTLAGRLLALRPAVVVGLMSYSAYLWHQPLLAFARIAGHGDPRTRVAMVFVTFALAWATLILVERPFRNRSFLRQWQVFAASGAGAAALLAVLGFAIASQGFRASYPGYLQEAASMTPDTLRDYVGGRYHDKGQGDFAPDGRKRLLLVGDSFSEDFYNMILENGAFPDYQIALRLISTDCQIYLGPEDITRYIAPQNRRKCENRRSADDVVGISREADVVVFAANWREWAAERLPETLAAFDFRPDQTVVVIGRKAFSVINRPMTAGKTPEELAAMRAESRPYHLEVVRLMRQLVPPATLVDPQALVCGGDACPMFTPKGELISGDGSHLTRAGARYVGRLLFTDPSLRPFAADATAGDVPARGARAG
jgi:peptidoglycan/LPS O-acetylase OafA/YrhL